MLVNIPENITLPIGTDVSAQIESDGDDSVIFVEDLYGAMRYEIHLPTDNILVSGPLPEIRAGIYDLEEENDVVTTLYPSDEPALEPYPMLVQLDALIIKGEPHSVIYLECGSNSWGVALGYMGSPVVAESPRGSFAYYLGPKGFRQIG